MHPKSFRPLALVAVAVLALSGCASKKDPTADGSTTSSGLGTFGPSSPGGAGSLGAGVGVGTGTGAYAAGLPSEPVAVGGVGTGTGGDLYGSGSTVGGIDGTTLGGVGQTGSTAYTDQGGVGTSNGFTDGGVISAAPQYTDGTVYTDSTTYGSGEPVYTDTGTAYTDGSGALQPYDSGLYDNSATAGAGIAAGGSNYATQGGGSALGGYTFPGDNGQPSYFATQVGNRVLFETDSSVLSPQARETLRRQAAWLQLHPEHSAVLEGHADERGTREYNLALGARRADSVLAYMTSLGVAPGRLRTVSYGKERPVSLGSNPSDWARNRRVETALNSGASF